MTNKHIVKREISGWGRYPRKACRYIEPNNELELASVMGSAPLIARGAGRSYGDSSICEDLTVSMRKFNNFIEFNETIGAVTVEAGVILDDIIKSLLPHGWFPIVTPGTKYVTVGGMIAADVHGKNHHINKSFGHYVLWLDLMLADGNVIRCSNESNSVLFKATIGGMGLTGVIIRACFRLLKVESAWLQQEIITTNNWEVTNNILIESRQWPYVVAWIDSMANKDCIGRGLVLRAKHAELKDLPSYYKDKPFATPKRSSLNIPFNSPLNLINLLTAKAINQWTYNKNKVGVYKEFVDCDSYFYPLDYVFNWNTFYGKPGFIQFQCLIPFENKQGIKKLLKIFSQANIPCFLATVKILADQQSTFSFPGCGYTLTLDIPASNKSISLLQKLHKIVLDYNGRFYLAKDSCLNTEDFYSSDDRVNLFYKLRKDYKLNEAFVSEQSRRLEI